MRATARRLLKLGFFHFLEPNYGVKRGHTLLRKYAPLAAPLAVPLARGLPDTGPSGFAPFMSVFD